MNYCKELHQKSSPYLFTQHQQTASQSTPSSTLFLESVWSKFGASGTVREADVIAVYVDVNETFSDASAGVGELALGIAKTGKSL